MEIGKRIKQIREFKGLTQAELATKAGVTSVSLSRWESGDRDPKFSDVEKIAKGLNASVKDLVSGEPIVDEVQSEIEKTIYEVPEFFRFSALCSIMSVCSRLYPKLKKEHDNLIKQEIARFFDLIGHNTEEDE